MSAFRPISLSLVSLLVGVQVACQSVTPTDRIGSNPVMFRMLPSEQQALVQQGRICEGMSKDAVYLAWGNPNAAPVMGQQNGASYEKWVYLQYQPVVVDTFGFRAGCVFHDPLCCGSGMGTATTMVPREVAWVMFQNNVVTAWESRR